MIKQPNLKSFVLYIYILVFHELATLLKVRVTFSIISNIQNILFNSNGVKCVKLAKKLINVINKALGICFRVKSEEIAPFLVEISAI